MDVDEREQHGALYVYLLWPARSLRHISDASLWKYSRRPRKCGQLDRWKREPLAFGGAGVNLVSEFADFEDLWEFQVGSSSLPATAVPVFRRPPEPTQLRNP